LKTNPKVEKVREGGEGGGGRDWDCTKGGAYKER